MIELFFQYCRPIKILVFVTLVFALANLHRSNKMHLLLLGVLLICFATETLVTTFKILGIANGLLITISIILHDSLWLLILTRGQLANKNRIIPITVFWIFGISNLLFWQGLFLFNYYTFVAGAFFYIAIFLHMNFKELKSENILFFFSNEYVLLFTPVVFFIGLSFMFGFSNSAITSARIANLKLYDIVIHAVDLIYYTLINIYIYRERKLGIVEWYNRWDNHGACLREPYHGFLCYTYSIIF